MTRNSGAFRLYTALGILFFSSQTFCADTQWEPLRSDKEADWYLLKGSIVYDKGFSTLWMMANYKSEQVAGGDRYRSLRFQYSLECSNFSSTPVWVKAYDNQMGTGVEVFSQSMGSGSKPTVYSPSDWEASYARFCKKKWEFWK
jgi:hypothetical protein